MSTANGKPPNVAEMVVIHKVFRRELRLLPELIRQVAPGDAARADVLAGHGRLLLDGLHEHHQGEDDLVWPKLLERAAPDRELIERMQRQHERIAEVVRQVTDEIGAWERTAGASLRDHLAGVPDELHTVVVEHLDEEEQRLLPVISEHLTAAEWDAIGERFRATTPRNQLPILFGAILEDATPEERAFMLEPIPAPIKLLLRTFGARQYRRYVKKVRGVEPARR